MEFLGVGYQELLLILVLMLVVVGPERLPHMAYQIGKAVKTMQGYARAVRDEFSDELGYLEEQYKTVKGEIDTANQQLREANASLSSELRAATDSIDGEIREATAPLQFPVTPLPSSGNGALPGGGAPDTPSTSGEDKPAPLLF